MYSNDTISLPDGGEQLVYRTGDGPPLVWLHAIDGVTEDHPLIRGLAQGFTVYLPLAPGFRDVTELIEIHDHHDLALRYDDLLETLGLSEATVVGHSFGAMIAAELAAHCPSRVSRLVLISPLGLWNDHRPVADIFATPYPELPALLYADMSKAPVVDDSEEDVEKLVALASGMTSVAKYVWPLPDRGIRRRLHRVSAPTLVIFGEQDAVVSPAYAAEWVSALPSATNATVAGAGHMVAVERPDEVLGLVQNFLRTGTAG